MDRTMSKILAPFTLSQKWIAQRILHWTGDWKHRCASIAQPAHRSTVVKSPSLPRLALRWLAFWCFVLSARQQQRSTEACNSPFAFCSLARSYRSGACGLIWLNTGKLTRSRHSEDWQIESSFLILWVVVRKCWCLVYFLLFCCFIDFVLTKFLLIIYFH